MCPKRPEEGINSLRAGITGIELPDVGAGIQPLVFKIEKQILLTTEPSFQLPLLGFVVVIAAVFLFSWLLCVLVGRKSSGLFKFSSIRK